MTFYPNQWLAVLTLSLALSACGSDSGDASVDAGPRVDAGLACNNNGNVEGTEECDGSDLGNSSCASQRPGSTGTLVCTSECKLDASGCEGGSGSTINNGHLTTDEACDGNQFGILIGSTCQEATNSDLTSGDLLCTDTGTLSFENCTEPDVCALQGFREVGDGCDPCEVWGGTANVARDPDCDSCVADEFCADRWDVFAQGWACELSTGSRDPDCPACGNGVRDADGFSGAGERCDGTDFGSATCMNLGYTGGTLACDSNCNYDHSGCVQ